MEDDEEPPQHYQNESGDDEESFLNGVYEDQNGQEWTYDIHTSECDDPSNCGSPDEQHWVECDPPPWCEDDDLMDESDREAEGSDCQHEQDGYLMDESDSD